ncbi:MaoC/PaaZ C-terminal domain-containing protein [Streptomyces sp. NPDC056411]|uniref:MaoC/PaaZ C-terminal domain-containing protein n=1 Tax=Streptomyces sp. NPDC056411 TaxID=3345813 RepID=UPI0035DA7EE7
MPRVRAGDTLPPLEIPITRTLIVAGALASRDYQDVHHDAEAAKEKGSPDIFMNILTTNGLVGRYVTDHFGPRCTLRKVAIRLGVPNYPGDTMTLTGTVTEVTATVAEVAGRVAEVTATVAEVAGTVTEAPGTVTEATGTVAEAPDTMTQGTGRTAAVRIVGANSLGHHVTGTVTVSLPEDAV